MCDFPLSFAFPFGGCSPVEITSVELVTNSLLRINFNIDVITDDTFFTNSNYAITFEGSSSTDVLVKRVQQVFSSASDSAPSTSYALVSTSPFTLGQYYTITVSNLISRYGTSMLPSSKTIQINRTKTDLSFMTIPSHFDKRPEAIVSNVLAAITRSDELIGGSFNYEKIYE